MKSSSAFDLLGRRWAMGIVWNLAVGPSTFRGLQDACESISPSILNKRLKDLREALIVERTLDGYQLAELDNELDRVLEPFGQWSLVWAESVSPEERARWRRAQKR